MLIVGITIHKYVKRKPRKILMKVDEYLQYECTDSNNLTYKYECFIHTIITDKITLFTGHFTRQYKKIRRVYLEDFYIYFQKISNFKLT